MKRTSKSADADIWQSKVDRVVKNGLRVVQKGIEQLWDTTEEDHLKYSVISFYTGVELLLKARLMMEHWTLVVVDVKRANITKFLEGDFKSVGQVDAIKRIENVTGETFPKNAEKVFDSLRAHRNKMVHFYHPIDDKDGNAKNEKELVIKEQCRCWFHLRRLLQDQWGQLFSNYVEHVHQINQDMKRHNIYLDQVFEQISPELGKRAEAGSVFGTCWACGHPAIETDCDGPQDTKCKVCLQEQTIVRYQCPNEECQKPIVLHGYDGKDWECPHCGEEFSLDDLLTHFTREGQVLDSDYLEEDGFGTCDQCETYPPSVGTISDSGIFCFACFAWHDGLANCQWCNQRGTSDMEESYYAGCSECGGLAEHSKNW